MPSMAAPARPRMPAQWSKRWWLGRRRPGAEWKRGRPSSAGRTRPSAASAPPPNRAVAPAPGPLPAPAPQLVPTPPTSATQRQHEAAADARRATAGPAAPRSHRCCIPTRRGPGRGPPPGHTVAPRALAARRSRRTSYARAPGPPQGEATRARRPLCTHTRRRRQGFRGRCWCCCRCYRCRRGKEFQVTRRPPRPPLAR